MPYVLEMNLTPEQAEGLRLGDLHAGKVEWWYIKREAALEFPASWLPRHGRVAVRLTIEDGQGMGSVVQQFEPGPPTAAPVLDLNQTLSCISKPNLPGVVEARIYKTAKRPPFLPIVDLKERSTRHAVERYLSGCTVRTIQRWLSNVGYMQYLCESFPAAHKYRFVSRSGYETTVDLVYEKGMSGLHIVY